MKCPICGKYHPYRYFTFAIEPEKLIEVKYCDECGCKLKWEYQNE